MRTLIRYIIKQSLGAFLMGLAGFIVFVSLELLYQLADIIVRYQVGIDKLFLLIYYNLPMFAVMGIPVGVLLAIFWTLSRMRSDNELIAIQTHGISLKKLVVPFLIFGVMMSVAAYAFNDYIVPEANRSASEALAKFVYKRPEVSLKENTFIDNGRGQYLYIKRIVPETGELEDVLLYDLSGGSKTVTNAEKAVRDESTGKWLMKDGRTYTVDNRGFLVFDVEFGELELDLGEDIQQYIRSSKAANEMTSSELRLKIESYSKLGIDIASLQVALQEKYSMSIAPFIIVLLGVPISLVLNLKSKSWSVILTFVLVVIYQGSGAWLSAMGKENLFNPVIAPWIPNIVFLLIGISAYLFIDSKPSYRMSEFFTRIFKFSLMVFLVVGLPTIVKAGNVTIVGNTTGRFNGNELHITDGATFTYVGEKFEATVTASDASVLFEEGKPISVSFWGNVIMITGDSIFDSDRLVLDLTGETVEFLNVYTETETKIPSVDEEKDEESEVPLYVTGNYLNSTMEASPTLNIEKGFITTCDEDHPHYRFVVSEAEVKPEEYAIVKNMFMYIGNVPVFYIPWYRFPLDDPERRPFDIDLSALAEAKTSVTVRYLDIEWLLLEGIWRRNWTDANDSFTIRSDMDTEVGDIEILGEIGETEDKVTDYGVYALYTPKLSIAPPQIGVLYLHGFGGSNTLKKPFKEFDLGEVTSGNKTTYIDPFKIKDSTLEATDMTLLTVKYSTDSDSEIEADLSGIYAMYGDENLWTLNVDKLNLPSDLKFEYPNFSGEFRDFKMTFFIGRRLFGDNIEYVVRSDGSLKGSQLNIYSLNTSVKSVDFKLSTHAEEWEDILKPESADDSILDVIGYKITLGRFETTGNIKATMSASPLGLRIEMPTSSKGKPSNSFKYSTEDSKFKIDGKYAIYYDSENEDDTERLFWFDPINIVYSDWLTVKSKLNIDYRYDNTIKLKTDNEIYKDFELINWEKGIFEFSSVFTPKYEYDFDYDTASPAATRFETTRNQVSGTTKNTLTVTPWEIWSSSIEYSPRLYYDFLESKLDLDHPGTFYSVFDTTLLKAEYSVKLDYESLVATGLEAMEWLGEGELKTSGKATPFDWELGHTTETILKEITSEASHTKFSLYGDFGAFYHKTESDYSWTTGEFGDIENKEELEIEFEKFDLALDVEWTYTSSPTEEEKNLKRLSLGAEINVGDVFSMGLKFTTPFIYKKKNHYDRIKLDFSGINVFDLDIKKLSVDFTNGYSEFNSSYKIPAKYFTEAGDRHAKFLVLDMEGFSYGDWSIDSMFFATKKASPSEISTYSLGISGLTIDGWKLFGGKKNKIAEYGIGAEYVTGDNGSLLVNINDLSLEPVLLKRVELKLNKAESSYLEIGTFTGPLKEVDPDDWDVSTTKMKPAFIDLHCMALEVFARFRFGEDVTKFSDFLDGFGLKYYITALSDRYLVLGLSQGNFFMRFKF